MIGTIKIFRCTGKVDGTVLYKINVVAHSYGDAERICKQWLKATDVGKVQWQCRMVRMDNPIYAEVVNSGS